MGLALAQPPIHLVPGHSVGHYKLLDRIGSGGMGEVFLAEHGAIGRRVALKVLHARHLGNAPAYQRFVREARLANKVRHPRVVEVTELGHLPDGRPWLAMEYVHGEQLCALWERGFSLERFYQVMDQILDALEAAHAAGVVHRDLKPANIQLLADGNLKLLDFGAARSTETHDDKLTQTGEVIATARYMSPEQATGEPVDARGDLYSLGVVMWELLVGRMVFNGHSFGEWVLLHSTREPVPPSRARDAKVGAIPQALDAIVLRCLAKRPDQRYSSAKELREELRRARAVAPRRRLAWLSVAAMVGAVAMVAALQGRAPSLRPAASPAKPPPAPSAPVAPRAEVPVFAPVVVTPAQAMEFKPVVLEAPKKRHRVKTPDAHMLKNPFGEDE
jgi:serine/threonine-protein kinase